MCSLHPSLNLDLHIMVASLFDILLGGLGMPLQHRR